MNINSVQNTYNAQAANNQAKLPTGAAAKETVNAFEKVITNLSSPMQSTDVNKTLSSITEGISSVEEQLKADAQAAKAGLKALFNKLSGAEAVKLDEDGFDINDIDDEELVTVVDRIKLMLMAYNENYQEFAGAFQHADKDSVDSEGNLSAKVASALEDSHMPVTEDNMTDVASTMEMAKDVAEQMPLSEEAKAYLIENQMEPTIENVYKANHSTINNGYKSGLAADQWEQLKPQVTKIVEQSGLEENEKVYEDAKWLIANELPVTKENLVLKNRLDDLTFVYEEDQVLDDAVTSMAAGNKASDVNLAEDYNGWKDAAKAMCIVNFATYENVIHIVSSGQAFTINSLEAAMRVTVEDGAESGEGSSVQKAAVSHYRALCEARALMTARATVSIMRQGFDIYTEDLHMLVELLREEETKFINEQLTKSDAGSISEADLNSVANVNDALMALRFAPCAAIGTMITVKQELTITAVSEISGDMQRQYEEAGQAYETMSTKVRSDMGDSVKAAVNNSAENILADAGMEYNEANMRAVRILAYNTMEMSQENIEQVKYLDSTLNNLMDNMSPQVVYDMIKEGINPMETDIADLNRYINEKYGEQDASVKYSEFLYKLEHSEEISAEERGRYIGIYKMFHMFRKDAGKAVGALLNQNADINLKNLVMAVNSRKKYDMDVTLDKDAGMGEVTGDVQYFENLFSQLGKTITPQGLKKVSDSDGDPEEISLEKMAELMEKYREEDKEIKEQYYTEMVKEAAEYQNIEDNVMRLITDYAFPVTFYNVMAAKELMQGNKVFRELSSTQDEKVTEKMASMLEDLDDREALEEDYNELETQVKEAAKQIMEGDTADHYLDMNRLKNLGKTVEFMRALGRRQQYFIPFATEEGIGSIRLKMVKTQENEGKMEMNFSTEALGSVFAQLHVTAEKTTGYIVTEKSGMSEKLEEALGGIYAGFEKLGIKNARILVGQGSEIPQVHLADEGAGVPSSLIYRTAKEILTNLITVKG